MVITRLEELEKAKVKVYIDHSYAFLLYRNDIKHYQLAEGLEITSEVYDKIIEDTVYRRAKQKALAILNHMDRTEQELRTKLNETGYPEDVINRTISYVYEYGYLNDERFASYYVKSKKNFKSKLVIKNMLLQKGVSKEIIDRIFEAEYEGDSNEDAEFIAITKFVTQKTKSRENLSYEEKQKIIASLYRKGFDLRKIKKIIDQLT